MLLGYDLQSKYLANSNWDHLPISYSLACAHVHFLALLRHYVKRLMSLTSFTFGIITAHLVYKLVKILFKTNLEYFLYHSIDILSHLFVNLGFYALKCAKITLSKDFCPWVYFITLNLCKKCSNNFCKFGPFSIMII